MDGELLGPDVSVADVVTVGMFWILFSSESEEVSLADTSKLALDKTSKASVIIFSSQVLLTSLFYYISIYKNSPGIGFYPELFFIPTTFSNSNYFFIPVTSLK